MTSSRRTRGDSFLKAEAGMKSKCWDLRNAVGVYLAIHGQYEKYMCACVYIYRVTIH